jgi:hypothetical protein
MNSNWKITVISDGDAEIDEYYRALARNCHQIPEYTHDPKFDPRSVVEFIPSNLSPRDLKLEQLTSGEILKLYGTILLEFVEGDVMNKGLIINTIQRIITIVNSADERFAHKLDTYMECLAKMPYIGTITHNSIDSLDSFANTDIERIKSQHEESSTRLAMLLSDREIDIPTLLLRYIDEYNSNSIYEDKLTSANLSASHAFEKCGTTSEPDALYAFKIKQAYYGMRPVRYMPLSITCEEKFKRLVELSKCVNNLPCDSTELVELYTQIDDILAELDTVSKDQNIQLLSLYKMSERVFALNMGKLYPAPQQDGDESTMNIFGNAGDDDY